MESTPRMIHRGLVRTNNGYIHYRSLGNGPAIALLHINQQSSAAYLELMKDLASDFTAIAVDFPGHGMSDHMSRQPSVSDYSDAVMAVMDALGISACHLLGEAIGAVVAVDIAARFPANARNLVLLNCPYVPGGTTQQTDARVTPEQRPSDSSGFPLARTIEFLLHNDAVHAPISPTQDWMDRINVAQMEAGRDRWQGLTAMHAYDLAATAPTVRSPVLAIYGEQFHFTPLRQDLVSMFREAQVEVIPNGRFCIGWEHAKTIGESTRAFTERRRAVT